MRAYVIRYAVICIIQTKRSITQLNNKIMKTITTHKFNKVKNTDADFLKQGIVAFQMVKFEINFYGNVIETSHDTKIMEDGSQIVIGGCGFIKEGFKVM